VFSTEVAGYASCKDADEVPQSNREHPMLRKVMWSGLYAGLSAAATMAARRTASKVWRVTTGEEPPTKK